MCSLIIVKETERYEIEHKIGLDFEYTYFK